MQNDSTDTIKATANATDDMNTGSLSDPLASDDEARVDAGLLNDSSGPEPLYLRAFASLSQELAEPPENRATFTGTASTLPREQAAPANYRAYLATRNSAPTEASRDNAHALMESDRQATPTPGSDAAKC